MHTKHRFFWETPRRHNRFYEHFALWHDIVFMFCHVLLYATVDICYYNCPRVFNNRHLGVGSHNVDFCMNYTHPWNRTNSKPLLWCHASCCQTDYIVLVLNITAADALETPEDRASTSMVLILFAKINRKKWHVELKVMLTGNNIGKPINGKPHCYMHMSFHMHNQYSIILKLHGVND